MTAPSPDDIATAIEIPHVYDGTAVYMLRDGSLVNRFRLVPGWEPWRIEAADAWIAAHGAKARIALADLLPKGDA